MSTEPQIGYGLTEEDLYEMFGCLVDWSSGLYNPTTAEEIKRFDENLLHSLIDKFKRIDKDVLTKIFNKWNTSGYGHEQIIDDVKTIHYDSTI